MTTPNNRYQILQQVREAGLAEEKDYLSVARLIAESLPDDPKARTAFIWRLLEQAHRNGAQRAAQVLADRANAVIENMKMLDALMDDTDRAVTSRESGEEQAR